MKRTILAAIIAALSVLALDDTEKDKKSRVANRKERQQDRVAEGVKDGSLTAKEAAKIEAKEAKLNREIRQDRKDGKGLTPKEKAKIEAKQDKMSKEIYKEKHDKQKQ
jgi:uncharacterized protein YdeI (BOF family)